MTKQTKTAWWVVGSGCIGCLGVIVIAAVGFGWLFFQGRQDLTPVVKEFLEATEAGDYETAYDMVGDGWKKQQSLTQFRAFHTLVSSTLGERHDLTSRGFLLHTGTQGRTARATYSAGYDNDNVLITVSLKKYGDEWKIEGCHYGSKLFAKDTVCAECGTANDASAQYCSQCGVQLEASPEPRMETPGQPGA